tara:strand:- start:1858 stop:3477 length:1620 start_codon:yes stop_codon:yes gene_type:complete
MKLALVQLNPIIGNLAYNYSLIETEFKRYANDGVDLIIFSECILTGYPPLDLLLRPDFILSLEDYLQQLIRLTSKFPNTALCIGTPRLLKQKLVNMAYIINNGAIIFEQFKHNLPNYDIFDEKRYFNSGTQQGVFEYNGFRIGITICEDAWSNDLSDNLDPISFFKEHPIDVLINLSASPFEHDKQQLRYEVFKKHALTLQVPVIMVNQVGGNDHLIFDGSSFCLNANGDFIAQLKSFTTDTAIIDLSKTESPINNPLSHSKLKNIHDALVLGIRDYVHKTGFNDVVIGLSGGIDSAVTCALAVAALGKEHVKGVSLPSPFSSKGSLTDAKLLADTLDIHYSVIPINSLYEQFISQLNPVFKDKKADITEENIQARCRGTLLMAIANKFNALVLSTGNKSEIAMGYCTLYGDMCGALSVLADVYKTEVYQLAEFINQDDSIIPVKSITKPPSAELRPNQKDSDSLPSYDILDPIINAYINLSLSKDQILSDIHSDEACVDMVIKRIHFNEYKRKQAPTLLRVSTSSFVMGRRFPIAASY